MTTRKGSLLLLPNLLGNHRSHAPFLPSSVDEAVKTIDGLIAESEAGGRRFLSRFETKKPTREIPIALYQGNKTDDVDFLLEPIVCGQTWGLISDAGLPCIADPGAAVVRRARQRGISVSTFAGPCSIVFALMLSGLSGQAFSFRGYLDRDRQRCEKMIAELERESQKERLTQIVMEAPYRSEQLLEQLISVLSAKTRLSVAWELTMPKEGVITQTVSQWRRFPLPSLKKKETIFLFQAGT